MKNRLLLLLLPLWAFSCATAEEKPADVVSEDVMTSVLLEVHLTEARINRTIPHYDSSRLAYRAAHQALLKKYNLTDSSYKHSYDYYISNPRQMDKIYERVLDSLSLKEAKLTPKGPAEIRPVNPITE